jgi:micrococcal nuclease
VKKSYWNLLRLAIFVILSIFYFNNPADTKETPIVTPTPQASSSATLARVTKVYDGDTIQIESGEKVRYIGIDSAEIYPKRLCFSEEAFAKNKELVLEKVVRLEKDVSETDKYGRLLRYVYIDNEFVNDELVRNGFAKVATYPPDVKYKDIFLESQKFARENNLGLWSKCFQ